MQRHGHRDCPQPCVGPDMNVDENKAQQVLGGLSTSGPVASRKDTQWLRIPEHTVCERDHRLHPCIAS